MIIPYQWVNPHQSLLEIMVHLLLRALSSHPRTAALVKVLWSLDSLSLIEIKI